jgi:hypothetical protein
MNEKVWTYEEFVNTMILEDIQGWAYEGISIRELYKDYLESQQEKPYFPEWAQ